MPPRAFMPPRDEFTRFCDAGMSDYAIGRHYHRSASWARHIRNQYAIEARTGATGRGLDEIVYPDETAIADAFAGRRFEDVKVGPCHGKPPRRSASAPLTGSSASDCAAAYSTMRGSR